jgi:hypothetical protein
VRGAVPVAGKEDVWTCDYSRCLLRLKIRKEYLLVHLQEYHDEDVGCTDDEELASREVNTSFWRCSWCLTRNNSRNSWKCQNCNALCEDIRIRARTTASDHRDGMGYDAPNSIPTYTSSTESPQTDIPIPRIGPRELQEQPSVSRSQASTGNVPHAVLDFPATATAIGVSSRESRLTGASAYRAATSRPKNSDIAFSRTLSNYENSIGYSPLTPE